MKIYLGSDHRGFALKNFLKNWLLSLNYEVIDCGALVYLPDDDFTDYAKCVAEGVSKSVDNRGIVLCGSGVGVDIVANKVKGIRCGLGFDIAQIQEAREDDDINILALSSDATPERTAVKLVSHFLDTKYVYSKKHQRRIEKIES